MRDCTGSAAHHVCRCASAAAPAQCVDDLRRLAHDTTLEPNDALRRIRAAFADFDRSARPRADATNTAPPDRDGCRGCCALMTRNDVRSALRLPGVNRVDVCDERRPHPPVAGGGAGAFTQPPGVVESAGSADVGGHRSGDRAVPVLANGLLRFRRQLRP